MGLITPNPGSPEAIALNCVCAVLDNNHGAGNNGLFWVNEACPLHGFSVDGIVHSVGDPHCPECFGDWPKPCACGGLVHREQDSDADDAGADSWYEFFDILRCDKCDDPRI